MKVIATAEHCGALVKRFTVGGRERLQHLQTGLQDITWEVHQARNDLWTVEKNTRLKFDSPDNLSLTFHGFLKHKSKDSSYISSYWVQITSN